MTYIGTWPPAGDSALFKSGGLKRPDEYLTESDLEEQYGFMTDTGERMVRQQMQVMGRPLTRAEQRGLTHGKTHSGLGGGRSVKRAGVGFILFLALFWFLTRK